MPDAMDGTTDAATVAEEQFNVLLAYLERPDVIWQLVMLLGLLFLSYVLAVIFQRLLVRYAQRWLRGRSQEMRDRVLNRWVPAIDQLDWPLIALLLNYVTIPFLHAQGRTVGLLAYSTNFFWILLAYQTVLTVLYALYRRQAVQRYHKSVFAPAFGLLTIWGVLSFLNIDEVLRIRLGQLFDANITLGSLIGAFIVLYVFIALSWVVQDAMRVGFSRFEQDPGLVNSILTITRYMIIIIGIIVTLNTLGFSPATLAAIAGGLSLGAGLGLQRIVGNFVSGIVLLLEQSVRPGDIVVIGSDMGMVKRINIRSTIVNRLDNVDLIIPNENLITSTVTTYNTELALKRVEVRVGASYKSDPTYVRKVLEETAAKHGLVLEDPAPVVFFLGFGESSLNFVLWAWVADNDKRWPTQSDLHYMVSHAFKAHGIEIPYPQRDLHVQMPQSTAVEDLTVPPWHSQERDETAETEDTLPRNIKQSQPSATDKTER